MARRSGLPPEGYGPLTLVLLYLYAILPAGSRAEAALHAREIAGVEGEEPLFPIASGDLIAAVSRVSSELFEEEPLNKLLSDINRVAPLALKHEQVVRALMTKTPALVPVAFGRVFRSEDGVRDLLSREGESLRTLLRELEGTQEWSVLVTRDSTRVQEAVETSSDRLRTLETEAEQSAPGQAYLLQKQKERARAAETAQFAAQAVQDIAARLAETGSRMVVEELPPHTPGELDVALKAALLMPEYALDGLQRTVQELNEGFGPAGFSIEIKGPWAPYSFVALRQAQGTAGKPAQGTGGHGRG